MSRKTRKSCPLCQHTDRDQLEIDILNGNLKAEDLDKEMRWFSGSTRKHMQNHLGEYHDHSNPSCILCTFQNRADIEMQIRDAIITTEEAAEYLNTSIDQVHLHMKKHLQPLVQKHAAMDIARLDLNEIDLLAGNIGVLQDKVGELLNDTELSFKQIDSLTKLAKEIRESLKYLLEFKGQLIHKREETVIIKQVEIIQKVLIDKYPEVWTEIRDNVAEMI